tara:strand:- start:182 stop:457 length:276 start_codon:yes stop_codon:yes gene_type:complete
VKYFTASCDDLDTQKKFAEKLKVDYPILSDPGREAASKYGVVHGTRLVPERWTFYIGKDGKILHIDKKVSAAKDGATVAKKLEELKVEKKN